LSKADVIDARSNRLENSDKKHEAYTVKALQDYRAGARVGTQAAMAEAVRGLSDADFEDLAYFLARVRP